MAKWRVLTPDEAMTLMALADEYHDSKRPLPPQIVELKKEIEEKTRNAELFMAFMRVVDYGMVDEIVELKIQLDTLYGVWAIGETPSMGRTPHKRKSLH